MTGKHPTSLPAWMKFLNMLKLLLPGAAIFLGIFSCYKITYVYAYYVKYSADQLVDGPTRTCEKCSNSSSIPRLLHHSWKNSTIPPIWRQTYSSCLDAHRDYTHMLWTDEDMDEFIKKEYSWFYLTYSNYKYNIERVDAARYFILYHYGGVYIDLDIGCRIPTHEMLAHTEGYKVIIPEGYPTGLTNWFMASTPQHPLFRTAIRDLQQAEGIYGTPYMSIMWSTGPMFLTKCASKTQECRTELLILRFEELFRRFFWKAPGGSWHKPDAVIFLFLRDLAMNWRTIVAAVSLSATVVLLAVCVCKRRKLSPCFYKVKELQEIKLLR